ncbi:MAG: family 10 glycosylhydrolase [Candidatus Pacebacteria bacterium]|nr:family 10 glycosylhydrolase [Candidatus Paceibacterota bacterium]
MTLFSGVPCASGNGLTVDYPIFLNIGVRSAGRTGVIVQPAVEGLRGPRRFRVGDVDCLRFQCPFSQQAFGRAAWDMLVRLDLRRADGIRFKFRAVDISSVGYFSFHFKSGNGWYTAEFTPRATGEWETIHIRKADTVVEGTPAGWGRIGALRISAWRGEHRSTAFDIAAIGARRCEDSIVIVRGVPAVVLDAAEQTELAGSLKHAQRIAGILENYGVVPAFVDEADVDAPLLASARTVVLPYNPFMTDKVADGLAEFVEKGGTIVGFYTIHPKLQAVTRIRKTGYMKARDVPGGIGGILFRQGRLPGAPRMVPQQSWNVNLLEAPGEPLAVWQTADGQPTRLPAVVHGRGAVWMSHVLLNSTRKEGGLALLAMVGSQQPGVWRIAAHAALRDLGKELPHGSVEKALAALAKEEGHDQTVNALARQIRAARRHAVSDFNRGRYRQSLVSAQRANWFLKEAYFRAQRSVSGEFRGVWCHRGYGIKNWSWEQTLQRLEDAGFNTVMPNMMDAVQAWYPSRILYSRWKESKAGDPLDACLRAARGHNIDVHVWMMVLRFGDTADKGTMQRLENCGRTQVDVHGNAAQYWLCPNSPDNRRRVLQAVAEVAHRYPIDGLHLDYVRFAGANYCYCSHCRGRFEAMVGHRIEPWPSAVRENSQLARQWAMFRQQTITSLVRTINTVVDQVRPGIALSAAVFPDPNRAGEVVGQDWSSWAENDYVDFICPMNYTSNRHAFAQLLHKQTNRLEGTGTRLYPGIGLRSEELNAVEVIEQIKAVRAARTGGFVVFEYDLEQAVNVFPHLAKGVTKPSD